ncbi:hypothetical protein DMA15_30445 [Streptomyces sp. WAC 01529]|uniref:hypothetical protein n=1 Tax=Streptomyces sp. WAC 01529 TaxID=2203205 RepID=UPI000F714FC4|nr:hypothetical protein [Streptomyces sp. WAC 01529]AZM56370.1 hypothetical protein DMA15_30445 [Streptomyces sp. WAC 01529]
MWDEGQPLRIAQDRGAALLDNATVAGATTMLESPGSATLADEQSLADLLEAIVLHEALVIDSWGDSESYPISLLHAPYFSTFPSLTAARSTSPPEGDLLPFTTLLVKATLDRLERALSSGELAEQHRLLLSRLGGGELFSAHFNRYYGLTDIRPEVEHLYRSDATILRQALAGEAAFSRVHALEDAIDRALQGASDAFRRYCMFLLRAFYYEELADKLSLSYMPHTYRAEAMLKLPRPGGGPSTREFAGEVVKQTGRVRAELASAVRLSVTIDMPAIASMLAHSVGSRSELLAAATELRGRESVAAFRRWVREQELALQHQSDLLRLRKAMGELEGIVADLRTELLGANVAGGHPVTLRVTTAGVPVIPGFPVIEGETEVHVRSPAWLRRLLRRRLPHLTFFSQLSRELATGKIAPFHQRLRELGS